MKRILLFITISFLVACNNEGTSTESGNDTVLGQTEASPIIAQVQKTFPQLFLFLKSGDAQFAADSFYETGEVKLSGAPAQPLDEENILKYKKWLIYNKDSSLALDLYSYNFIINNKEGDPHLESAEPDTEIALVDFKNKTRKRIYFSGPSYTIWEGAWVQNGEAVLAGAEIKGEGKRVPLFWYIHFAEGTIQMLEYTGIVIINMEPYLNKTIKKPL